MELIELLKIRYDTVLQSPTDSLFYQNVHDYIDLIVKTPEFYSIMRKAEVEYSEQHAKIWQPHTNSEDELDERSQRTYKLERFNLYTANYVVLFVRIYLPIEDFKVSINDPIYRQDPVAMLMLYGVKSQNIELWCKNHKTMPYRDALKEVRVYNRWFDGKRNDYENNLKQFHPDFLSAYLQQPKPEKIMVEEVKIPLYVHPVTGDFSFYGVSGTFNPQGQEFKVLSTLLNSDNYQAEYPELIQSYRVYKQESSKVLKPELSQIIKNIKEKLKILPATNLSNPDIIGNVKNLGYRLVFPTTKENP